MTSINYETTDEGLQLTFRSRKIGLIRHLRSDGETTWRVELNGVTDKPSFVSLEAAKYVALGTFIEQDAREMKERLRLTEIARGAIERHLGDVCEGEDSADSIYDEAFTLATDALHDAGVTDPALAGSIASEVAQCFAQP